MQLAPGTEPHLPLGVERRRPVGFLHALGLAAQRVAELRTEGETAGKAAWRRIENACGELLRMAPGAGERVS